MTSSENIKIRNISIESTHQSTTWLFSSLHRGFAALHVNKKMLMHNSKNIIKLRYQYPTQEKFVAIAGTPIHDLLLSEPADIYELWLKMVLIKIHRQTHTSAVSTYTTTLANCLHRSNKLQSENCNRADK